MPFSSQPRKKGTPKPQEGTKPSCGHSALKKDCPECGKSPTAKVIPLPTEKKIVHELQQKVAELLKTNSKAADKAAFILAEWINKKKK